MQCRIMVGLDGSPPAERAIAYALTVARARGAHVRLVHVVHPPPEDAARFERWEEVGKQEAYLAGVAQRLAASSDGAAPRATAAGTLETAVLVGEDAAETLLWEAERCEADLVVLGTHGRSWVGRLMLGSVADDVLRRSRLPVLLVPPTAPPWPAGTGTVTPGEMDEAAAEPPGGERFAVVALDGSPAAEASLPAASQLATCLGASLLLLRVLDDTSESLLSFATDADWRDATQYLEEVAERLREAGQRVAVQVERGDAAEVIAEMAEQYDAAFIALATRGFGGLRRAVLGSTTTRTLRVARRPLLVCHQRAPLPERWPAMAGAQHRVNGAEAGDGATPVVEVVAPLDLTAAVTEALAADPRTAGAVIEVMENAGTVTLRGTLSHSSEATAAVEEAERVPGVALVISELSVREPDAVLAPPPRGVPHAW